MIEHVVNTTSAPVPLQKKHVASRRESLWPILSCTFAYILCILFSVALVFNISPLATHLWISHLLLLCGSWIPTDFGPVAQTHLSHQQTGYLELMVIFACMFAAYGFCAFYMHQLLRFKANHTLLPIIWVGALIGGFIYLFTPGIMTTDLYSYASYGRLLLMHAANPYFVPPSTFPHDPVYQFLYWKNTVSIYGPIWNLVCAFLATIAGTRQMEIVVVFRLFEFAAHLVNILLVTAILRALGRSYRTVIVGTLLYAWNPLVLAESSLGAHNDVFMVTFLLLGIYLCARAEQRHQFFSFRGYAPAMLAFTLAFLVKFSAAPAIAVFVIALFCAVLRSSLDYRQPLAWRTAFMTSCKAIALSLALTLLLYGPFWLGHSLEAIATSFSSQPSATASFNSLLSTVAYLQGTHSLAPWLSFLLDRRIWNVVTVLAFCIPVITGCFALWHAPTTRTLVIVTLTSLATFLVFTPWFFAWYLTWLVALAVVCLPVITDRRIRALVAFSLTFSATSLLTYYSTTVGYLLLRQHNAAWSLWMILGTLGIPLLVFFACLLFWPKHQLYLVRFPLARKTVPLEQNKREAVS